MKIVIGSDHRGFGIKEALIQHLRSHGHELVDQGTNSEESVDYSDYAIRVGLAVSSGEADRGVLICGTGIGMCIAANKVNGIRAALVCNEESARLSRAHNNSNVLCLSGNDVEPAAATSMLDAWLKTEFEGGRHSRRLDKIAAFEKSKIAGNES